VSIPKPSSFKNEEPSKEHAGGIDIPALCNTLLRIVARLDEKQYTHGMSRQTVERQPDDLADPASDDDTSQG
jgi:hypothetical protein